jgi:hypothetical protein
VVLGAVVALYSAPASGARITVASGLDSGPQITGSGLVWHASSAEMLTGRRGRTRKLPGGSGFALTSPTSDWMVVVGNRRILAGRIGGRLAAVAVLRRCRPPIAAGWFGDPRGALLALSGSRLYAVINPRCLRRPDHGKWMLLSIDLQSGSSRLLTAVSKLTVSLSASERRVAVTRLRRASSSTVLVIMRDAADGRRLSEVAVNTRMVRVERVSTQVDDRGDVLVLSSFFRPPAGGSVGWWAKRGGPVRELGLLAGPSGAALSDGRIAYARKSESGGQQRLVVLNLRRGSSRVVADFVGEAKVTGLDLSGGELAWAQDDTAPVVRSEVLANGATSERCQVVQLGPVRLRSIDLRAVRGGPLQIGAPLPVIDQPPCTLIAFGPAPPRGAR